jgi:predicted phage tail component-like protein
LISSLPPISKPPIRTRIETVDGRDGDIVTTLGYEAYDKPIKIGLTYNYDIDEIIEYFNSSGEVIFSNEPDKYYRYAIYEQIDFERLIRFKTAEVVLHVQPFKFSTIEKPQTFTVSSSPASLNVYNAGNTYARPIITITATGDVALSLNGSEILNIEFGETAQTIIINCEELNAYNEQNILLNRLVTGNYDNIKLNKGSNEIGLTGNVSSLTINKYSRWI